MMLPLRNNLAILLKSLSKMFPSISLNLAETYGKPIDYIVHYEKLNNVRNKGMVGGTRFIPKLQKKTIVNFRLF